MELRDETGSVIVHLDIDASANGRRLEITSALTGESRYADALMLEVLTWLPGELLGEPPTEQAENPDKERFEKRTRRHST
jgi:hypothetical protein